MKNIALIILISILALPSAYGSNKKTPCEDSLGAVSELEKKLISHVKSWIQQYSGVMVEKVEVKGSQIIIQGIQTQSPNPRIDPPKKIRYRTNKYQLKIKITAKRE